MCNNNVPKPITGAFFGLMLIIVYCTEDKGNIKVLTVCLCLRARARTHTHICVCMCVCVYIYIYIYIYIE